MKTFVSPLPGTPIFKWLSFDFPADSKYRAPGCLPNLNPGRGPEAPGVEDIYGKLGYPPMEQGFPLMREYPWPEPEDPRMWPLQDQILDQDRQACICHTGRLSGSFVKYIVQSDHKSHVKMRAKPLDRDGKVEILYDKTVELVPQTPECNKWFWLDPSTESELLYSARAVITTWPKNMLPGIYELIVHWEFWDFKKGGNPDRMPISGFCTALSFELSAKNPPF